MKKYLGKILIFVIFVASTAYAEAPKILWFFDTFDSSFGQSAIDDIDGDGKYEIVFGCYRNDGMVYALNAEDGSLLWKFDASGSAEGCNDAAVLLFDITGDNKKEVIVASSCNPKTFCLNGSDGSIIWTADTRGSDSPPVIADIDNDGYYEILHGEFNGYVICLDAKTGEVKWELLVDPNSWVQTAPTLVDLNNDGTLDFVVATWGFNENSKFYAFDGATIEMLWSLDMNSVVYHGTAVADLDNDGKPELVIGDYSGRLYAINGEDGTLLWDYKENYYIGAPASIGDINGDGQCEVIFVSWNKAIALNSEGRLLWSYTIASGGTSFRGVVLSDITGDNLPEVIFGSSNGRVYALKGYDGSELWSLDLEEHIGKDFDIDHAPLIADFTGDGALELFIQGGKTTYPNFSENYGRAYAISLGNGNGPEWKMFQRDYYRASSLCYNPQPSSVKENRPVGNLKISPNPAKDKVYLSFSKNTPGTVKIDLLNLAGKFIKQLSKRFLDGGEHKLETALPSLPSGVYFIKVTANNIVLINSFIIE